MDNDDMLRVKGIEIEDSDGKLRLMLGTWGDGTPRIVLYDEEGHDRAELCLAPDGNPELSLKDANSNTRFSVVMFDDGIPCLSLCDSTKRSNIVIAVDEGAASIRVSETNEGAILIAINDDAPLLSLRGRKQSRTITDTNDVYIDKEQ